MDKYYNKFKLFGAAAILAGAVLMSGCGDSGSTSPAAFDPVDPVEPAVDPVEKAVTMAFDGDADGIPDVYADYADSNGLCYMKTVYNQDATSLSSRSGVNKKADSGVYTTPVRFVGDIALPEEVEIKDADDSAEASGKELQCDKDTYHVVLAADKAYTLQFSNPAFNGDSAAYFTPNVRIFKASDYEIIAAENVQDLPEPLDMTLLDGGDNQLQAPLISYSFTPESQGEYVIVINSSDNDQESEQLDYSVELFADPEQDGRMITFVDGDGDAYSNDDIQYILAGLSDYVEGTDDATGVPDTFADGAEDAFNQALLSIDSTKTDGDTATKTKLDSVVTGIRWVRNSFAFGQGLSALSGKVANTEKCVQVDGNVGWEPPKKDNVSQVNKTTIRFISNSKEHESALGVKVDGKYSGAVVTVTGSGSYQSNIKYTLNSTTLLLDYYFAESEPRRYEDTAKYQLTTEAKNKLDTDGPDEFRKEYGDYFIDGAIYGGHFIATLAITAETSEKIMKIKNKIGISVEKTGKKGELNEKFKLELKEALKNTTITLVKEIYGYKPSSTASLGYFNGTEWVDASDSTATLVATELDGNDPATIDALYEAFNQYVKDTQDTAKFKPAQIEAHLMHFHNIDTKASTEVNCTPDSFGEVRAIVRNFLEYMSGVKSQLDEKDTVFSDGKSYKTDLGGVAEKVTTDLNSNAEELMTDNDKRATYMKDMDERRKAMTVQVARCDLYSRLMRVSKRFFNNGWIDSRRFDEFGYRIYPYNKQVNDDITTSYHVEKKGHHRGACHSSPDNYRWEDSSATRFVWFSTDSHSPRGGDSDKSGKWVDSGKTGCLGAKKFSVHIRATTSCGDYDTWANFKTVVLKDDSKYELFNWNAFMI